MENRELSCIIDLINEAYPDLAILDSLDVWLSGRFQPPIAFIQTQEVTERGNTLTSYKIISDAGIVLHHRKKKIGGQEVYEPISIEPLRQLLRRERYSYRGKTDGLFINIDNTTFRVRSDKKDRTEITFRFEYTMAIPRPQVEKINTFEIEEEWS
ncbi:hypothetical protein I532_01490 [Brevibacillus borstelensis AK1]|jgi:hypothetical protein|uniref:Phage protein n=1 Tax=Brevibacillus borstelensis AK1 TaxID=1300222 RepID=M8DKT7_9BACL|nr:hypothetical protein [Brevibacillus borstelensis]EMT54238.1 hypothetical protein I532_01490 [Brevibacillus borstelensis AK1]